jgi:ATP-binding cassette subfamily G (WHITE) protein 2 (SNQ2)
VWRDYGIFWVYIVFQFALVFFCSWLYLKGGKSIVSMLRGTKRKEKKLTQEKTKDIGDEEV